METWTILESRVDWITGTASIGQGAHDLLTVGNDLVYAETLGGGIKRDWYWQGYQGCQCAHSSTGFRLDGSIVRLGGPIAGEHWARVARAAARITRIDVCLTAQAQPPGRDLATEGFELSTSSQSQRRRPREFTILRTASGGSTLYSNKRSSERFGRLYEKGYESGGDFPIGSWRWEWEFKGDLATAVAQGLLNSNDVERRCLGVIATEQEKVDNPLPFSYETARRDQSTRTYGLSESERRMNWLKSSVAPAIEKLAVSYREEEILNALGMWYPTAPPVTGPDDSGLREQARRFMRDRERKRSEKGGNVVKPEE